MALDIMQVIGQLQAGGGGSGGPIGYNVEPGVAAIFVNGPTGYTGMCVLDSTHAIITYRDTTNNNYGTAVCISISGTTVSVGTPVVFYTAWTLYTNVTPLDATHAIVAFKDQSAQNGYVCLLTLSGTTISAATPVAFAGTDDVNQLALMAIDSTHAVVTYNNSTNSNYGMAAVITYSGTLTAGSQQTFNSANSALARMHLGLIDSTHLIVTYNSGNARVLTISGNTVTAGSAIQIADDNKPTRIAVLSSTTALATYYRNGDYFGILKVITINGTTLIAGSEIVFNAINTANGEGIALCKMSDTTALIHYTDSTGTCAKLLTVSGTTVSMSTQCISPSESGSSHMISKINATQAIVSFYDTNAGNSKTRIITIVPVTGGTSVDYTIGAGVDTVFESAETLRIATCQMDETHALVFYRKQVAPYHGFVRCLAINGTTVTAGAAVDLGININACSVESLSSTLAVASFFNNETTGSWDTCCFSLSGTTVTVGSRTIIENSGVDNADVAITKMNDTTLLTVARIYGGGTYYLKGACLTVLGTTVTSYGSVNIVAANSNTIDICSLSETAAIVVYKDTASTGNSMARRLTLSGTTISVGGNSSYETSSVTLNRINKLTNSTALITYQVSSGHFKSLLAFDGATITYSPVVSILGEEVNGHDTTVVDSTHAIVAYRKNVGSGEGYSKCLTINGTAIQVGAASVFESGSTTAISMCKLTTTKALVAYEDLGNSNYGTAKVLVMQPVVTGTDTDYTLGVGVPKQISVDSHTSPASVCKLDDTTILIAFFSSSSYTGRVCVAKVDGNVIVEMGATYQFYGDYCDSINICRMDATHAIVVCRNFNNAQTFVVGLSVSGTTVTSTQTTVSFNYSYNIDICRMDDTHAMIVRNDNASNREGKAMIATLSGTSVSLGSEYSIISTGMYIPQIRSLDSSRAICVFNNSNDGGYSTGVVLTIAGNVISIGTKTRLISKSMQSESYRWLSALDANRVVMCYKDPSTTKKMAFCIKTSGNNIVVGAEYTLSSQEINFVRASGIDSNHVLLTYRNQTTQYQELMTLKVIDTIITASVSVVSNVNSNPDCAAVCGLDSLHGIWIAKNSTTGYTNAYVVTLSDDLDVTLAAGIKSIFNNAASLEMSVCQMDDAHAIVTYRDAGNSNYGTACCLSISGTTLVAGTPYVFETSAYSGGVVASMDATNAIVAYAGASQCGAKCLQLSGTTITAGAFIAFAESPYGAYFNVCPITSTQLVFTYIDVGNNSFARAQLATLSGSTISFSTKVNFVQSPAPTNLVSCLLDSTTLLNVYRNDSGDLSGKACCVMISGTTLSVNPQVSFSTNSIYYPSVCKMDAQHAIAAWRSTSPTTSGKAVCLTMTDGIIQVGTTINYTYESPFFMKSMMLNATTVAITYSNTISAPSKLEVVTLRLLGQSLEVESPLLVSTNDAGSSYTAIGITRISDTKALLVYKDLNNGDYGTACIITTSPEVKSQGLTISPEAYMTFESGSTQFTKVCQIDATHAMVVYQDNGDSDYGKVVVLTLNGTTITAGTPMTFAMGAVQYLSICKMDSTHFIVAYQRSSQGHAICLTWDGTNPNSGSTVVIETGNIYYTSVCRMDDTHAIAVYQDNNNSSKPTACCITLTGTVISGATPVVIEDINCDYTAIAGIDSTHAIATYKSNSGGYLRATCLTLSGTTITPETPINVSSGGTYTNMCSIGTNKAIVVFDYSYIKACCLTLTGTTVTTTEPVLIAYETTNNQLAISKITDTLLIFGFSTSSNTGKVCLMDLNGTTLSPRDMLQVSSAYCGHLDLATFDGTHCVMTARSAANSYYGTAWSLPLTAIPVISGLTLTASAAAVFKSATSNYMNVCKMDSTHVVVVYQRGSDSNIEACAMSLSGTTLTAGTPVNVSNQQGNISDVTRMDATHAIVAWGGQSPLTVKANCLTLSGVTLTVGSAATVTNSDSWYQSLCTMDTTHAILAWTDYDGNNYGKAVCLTLSGTSVSVGSIVTFEYANTTNYISICSMSPYRAIVLYKDSPNSGVATACCLSLSGTTITAATPIVVTSEAIDGETAIVSMDSTHAIAFYFANSGFFARCLGLADTLITLGAQLLVSSVQPTWMDADVFNTQHSCVVYRETGTSNGKAICINRLETTLSKGAAMVFSLGTTHPAVCTIDQTLAVVAYRDDANSNYGTARCLTRSA